MVDLSNENLLLLLKDAHAAGCTTAALAEAFVQMVNTSAGKDRWHHLTWQGDIKEAALFSLTQNWRRFSIAKSQTPYPYLHSLVMSAFSKTSFTDDRWAEIHQDEYV